MNFGQLLAGAGVVGQGWREEEDAQRRSRDIELRTAEMNRLDRLRQEMLQAQRPAYTPVPQFAPSMPTRVIPPAAPAPAPASAAPPVAAAVNQSAAETARLNRYAATNQPAMSQVEADRLSLLRTPTAALDVFQAPAAAGLNLATATGEAVINFGGRLVNAVTGREVAPTDVRGPRFGMTPFYDRYVRGPEGMLQVESDAKTNMPMVSDAPSAAGAGRGFVNPANVVPDPQRLLQAMIKVESTGKPGAVSDKGAVGLMQVLPSTAMDPGYGLPNVFDFAQQMGTQVGRRNEAEAKRLLADPDVGAAYGQRYMDAMLQRYNGNLEHALAAYNAGPRRIDNWLAAGADFTKLPKETRGYIPKVLAALNSQAAPTAQAAAPTAQAAAPTAQAAAPTAPTAQAAPTAMSAEADFDFADPRAIPLEMQRAMQQRAEVEQLAGMYQRAGLGAQYMEARAKLMELDHGITYLQGAQGVQEFELTGDTRRLAAVWSQYAGVPIGVQPRSDGNFDIVVNGKRAREGLSSADVVDRARSAIDGSYRQQKSATASKLYEESFKAKLNRDTENAKQLAQMIREIAVQQTQGNTQLAVERLKQFRYDVKPTGAGDGTVVITPPGAGVPFLFNPSGRTITVDGVKITSNAAVPIQGLPSYGGVQMR